MRVRDDVLDTVVFIGTEAYGPFTPLGTGFLAVYDTDQVAFRFVVTAAHVVEMIAGDYFWVRYNTDADARTYRVAKAVGWYAQRERDLAAFPIGADLASTRQKFIPIDRVHWDKRSKEIWEPGLGDEVVTLGLYSSHFGALKNIPIVRVGNIALLPGEPVQTDTGYVTAYLVETRSIAGLSGSPVFLNTPTLRVKEGQLQTLSDPDPIPLGMMLGYHLVTSKQDQIAVPQFRPAGQRDETHSPDERNTGLAVVLPLGALFDMFESPAAQEIIARSRENHLAQCKSRPASGKPSLSE